MLRIKKVERHQSGSKPGLRNDWTEYQVRDGARIVARCDTFAEAQRIQAQAEIGIAAI